MITRKCSLSDTDLQQQSDMNHSFSVTVQELIPTCQISLFFQVSNGYFIHYFAPTDIQRIPKNVVFIIDESGSMSGKQIEQVNQFFLLWVLLGELLNLKNNTEEIIIFHVVMVYLSFS